MTRKILFICGTILMLACGESQEQLEGKINALQEEMKSSELVDKDKVSEIVGLYEKFVSAYPSDTKTPEYIEMQSKYYSVQGEYEKSLANYERIYNDFPEAANRAEALFMQAFITEVNMKDLDKAELLYKQFIAEFPEDDFVDDAQFSLQNMRMTPEELLQFFKQQQNQLAGDSVEINF